MLNAARHFGYQLPEVFAGLRREETSFPIAYPTAARPQAWAAGAPVLLLQTLLGLQPDLRRRALESVARTSCRRGRSRFGSRVCKRSTACGTSGSKMATRVDPA